MRARWRHQKRRERTVRRTCCSWLLRLVPLACLLSWLTPPIVGQSGATSGQWRSYGNDIGNTRYSPLDQINASNFKNLEVAWRFKTENLGPRPEFNLEGTPLMANGVVYATAGTRRSVVALDGATGELLWVHGEREGPRGTAAPRQLSGRGLAVLDRRARGADSLRHPRVPTRRARRQERDAGCRIRRQRHGRSEAR